MGFAWTLGLEVLLIFLDYTPRPSKIQRKLWWDFGRNNVKLLWYQKIEIDQVLRVRSWYKPVNHIVDQLKKCIFYVFIIEDLYQKVRDVTIYICVFIQKINKVSFNILYGLSGSIASLISLYFQSICPTILSLAKVISSFRSSVALVGSSSCWTKVCI